MGSCTPTGRIPGMLRNICIARFLRLAFACCGVSGACGGVCRFSGREQALSGQRGQADQRDHTRSFAADLSMTSSRDPKKKLDPETTIFDSLRGRFVVIDPQRHVWTQVSTEALKTFSAKVKLDAAAASRADIELHGRAAIQGRDRRRRHGLQKPLDGVPTARPPAKSTRVVEQYTESRSGAPSSTSCLTHQQLPPFPRMDDQPVLAERGNCCRPTSK